MRIPGCPGACPIPPQSQGDKSALMLLLTGRPALRILKEWAIPMYAMQLGLPIPAFETNLLPVLSTESIMRDLSQWPTIQSRAVYFGEGCPSLRLRPGEWRNPYQTTDASVAWECVIRFGLKFLEQGTSSTVERLRCLQGKILVTDTELGSPCHAKLVSAMYQYFVHKVPLTRPRLATPTSSAQS